MLDYTQMSDIKHHLMVHGTITSLEAIKEYGITRLSAVIYNLRHDEGMKITTTTQTAKARNGRPCNFAVYTLVKGDEANA